MRLEHEYAALGLTSLLRGEPMVGLGDDYQVTRVALQQEAFAAVDDLVVTGSSSSGDRTIRIACRRRPTLGRSSESTVKLFADFLRTLLADSAEVEAGRLALGLAVSGPSVPASELAILTDVARRQTGAAPFKAAVNVPGAYTAKVRARLTNVCELVCAALTEIGRTAATDEQVDELSWKLLRALVVLQEVLEGDAASGRTAIVSRLRPLTESVARANDLRLRLVEIASQSAIRSGALTRPILRAALRSFGNLGESVDFAVVRPQMDTLEADLRQRTRRTLPTLAQEGTLTLDRSAQRTELVDAIRSLPPGGVLLVRGEPDSGKSALALDAVEDLRASGANVLAMSLRDIPPDALAFRSAVGLAPLDLLSASPSGPDCVLLLDGAEVVQERDNTLLAPLLAAASATGMAMALVARDDAKDAVIAAVDQCGLAQPVQFVVGPLSDAESLELTAAIPELAILACDSRAQWLIRRVGLVELLLRAAKRAGGLPDVLSTEAEVFATVWSSLIRNGECVVQGVSPDDRETAVLSVASNLLVPRSADVPVGSGLSSLRSDGVLLARDRTAALSMIDSFAGDLLRDFALAALLTRDGLDALAQAGAPRWAIRAARLCAQIRLAAGVAAGPDSVVRAWTVLRSEFQELAETHGARWAELPWEALLAAGWADQAFAALTPVIQSDRSAIPEAIRCLGLRFSPDGACDPVVGAPLLSWILANSGLAAAFDSYEDDPLREFALSWLRGMTIWESLDRDIEALRPLRRQLRDLLSGLNVRGEDKEWLESLGLLGSDIDERSREVLHAFGADRPAFLASLVESGPTPDNGTSVGVRVSS